MSASAIRMTATWLSVRKAAALVLTVAIGMLLLAVPLFSQSSTGRILGVVTDNPAATVPGAPVDVTNVQTGVVH